MKAAIVLKSVAWVLLAGCHAGVDVGRAEKMSLEMAEIRLEPIGEFSLDGTLALNGDHLGRAYADQGFLEYRLFRMTNAGDQEVALFLGARVPGASAALTLKQKFWSACPRSMDPDHPREQKPAQEHFTVYTAEFDRLDSRLVFASGGLEVLPEIREDSDLLAVTPSRLRPGESAEYRIRVRLKPGSPLLQSLSSGVPSGGAFFFPPDRVDVSESNRVWTAEMPCRFTVLIGIEPDFILQDPSDHSLHSLHLGSVFAVGRAHELMRKPYRFDGLEIPDAKLPFQKTGLPILIP